MGVKVPAVQPLELDPRRKPSHQQVDAAHVSAPRAVRKRGKPPYEPTEKDRELVRLLCAGGIKQDRIADALGIRRNTLAKHFSREIKLGRTEIDLKAINALVRAMDRDGMESLRAAIFWCQSRMGWREGGPADRDNPAEQPVKITVQLVGDAAADVVTTRAAPGSRLAFDAGQRVDLVG